MAARTARTIIAATYVPFPDTRSETRIVPAIAVPNEEPRFEMLRESPEISPCCASGKADCTRFTDGVSITPTPSPISNRPGANAHALDDAALTRPSRSRTPATVAPNPAAIRVFWKYFLASRAAASDEARIPRVAAVKITPVLIAL